jgi:MoxR-like ATPase
MSQEADIISEIETIKGDFQRIRAQFFKRIVGNEEIIAGIIKALISNGHVLLEGTPGLGKTLMVKTLSEILELDYRRIQFTPDLMPADIIGTNIIIEDDKGGRHFRFEKGPIFTHILLADEINRASPKTQSALLQAMEEHEVTIFGATHMLDDIFMTLATQNPIEMAGTYPLPEAQLDRFFFKLIIKYPSDDGLKEIAEKNNSLTGHLEPVEGVLSRERVLEIRNTLGLIPVTDRIYEFAVKMIRMTHPQNMDSPEAVKRYVRHGASPRGLNSLLAASRVSAIMDGRVNLALEDLEENYLPALRHRLIMKFEGEVEGIGTDTLLEEIFRNLKSSY